MMDIVYKRELSHSYMVIKSISQDVLEGYDYRMMTQNQIGRLLACSKRQLDGEVYLYYDISSRQPIERLFEEKKLDVEGLKRIVYGIEAILEDLGEYLLDERGLLLDAGTIFADVETEELYFCFYPEQEEIAHQYARLADFFLEHVDHGDEHAVNIAYQFYKMSKAEYFVLSAFLPVLEKELAEWREKKKNREPVVDRIPFMTETEGVDFPKLPEETEAFPEPETAPEGGWLRRILGGRNQENKKKKRDGRKRKEKISAKRHGEGVKEESGTESVWSGYEGQQALLQSGETVYFTDLEMTEEKERGTPCLTEEGGERQFFLDSMPLTVGKLRGRVSIVLTDSSVSRLHARFDYGEDGICVTDLNSRNGTLVNGKKLAPHETAPLNRGDLIQFGRERFRYGFVDSEARK